MNRVLVFRTNINTDKRIHQAACRLCKLLGRADGSICRWSIDLEDCDNVLRIETETIAEADIIRLLRKAGLECDVLD